MQAKTCKKCPDNSLSCYLDKIFVKQGIIKLLIFKWKDWFFLVLGYWRSGVYSENIYFCENFEERCMFTIKLNLITNFE